MVKNTLIISTYGAELRFKNKKFVVELKKKELGSQIPEKVDIIILQTSTLVTTNALMAALEHEIPVFIATRNNNIVGMLYSERYSKDPLLKIRQVLFSLSVDGLREVVKIIISKLESQHKILKDWGARLKDPRKKDLVERTLSTISYAIQNIKDCDISKTEKIKNSIRAYEGTASKAYFKAIGSLLPPEYRFKGRETPNSEGIFNIALNYAYGILYTLVKNNIIKAGLDPYIGIFHSTSRRNMALTFDLIEQFRTFADLTVIELLRKKIIKKDMITFDKRPAPMLNTEGCKIVAEHLFKYLEEKMKYKKRRISRRKFIKEQIFEFAEKVYAYKI